MPAKEYLVIYYDGNVYRAVKKKSDFPDSCMPHVWGMTDGIDIVAVIDCGRDKVTRDVRVWIEEAEQEIH